MSGGETTDAQQLAQTALTKSHIQALRDVHVERNGPSLILSGRVSSFYHKQLAQELVRGVCRNIELVNSIDVERV